MDGVSGKVSKGVSMGVGAVRLSWMCNQALEELSEDPSIPANTALNSKGM